MKPTSKYSSAAALSLSALIGCSGSSITDFEPATQQASDEHHRPAFASETDVQSLQTSNTGTETITYHRDVRPILEANCTECHNEDGIGPMRLDEWSTVDRFAGAIVNAALAGRMPPWPASSQCHDLKDNRALTDDAKAILARWREGGFREGLASESPPSTPPARPALGPPALLLGGDVPYTPSANEDSYRCFLVGAVDADTYVTALNILPGATSEVHHVQLRRVDGDQIAKVREFDEAAPEAGYLCSSGGVAPPSAARDADGGVDGGIDAGADGGAPAGPSVSSENMFSYRPGSVALQFSRGDAMFVAAGSGFVLQVHYNTQFLGSKGPAPDETRIALWTLPAGARPQRVIYRTQVVSPLDRVSDGGTSMRGSIIPANQRTVGGSLRPMSSVSRVGGSSAPFLPGEIIGTTPHAHNWATIMRSRLERASDNTCLIEVPRWDYHWQLDYLYQEGVKYGPDDVLRVECQFDNTAEHQPIINGERVPPRDIKFGERTLDEMCVHYFWLRFDYTDFERARSLPSPASPL